jgi:hypothetical protein
MDYGTTSEMLRLNRLEKRAQDYFRIGCTKSNLTRLIRATRLETAANARLLKLLTREIEAYRPAPPRLTVIETIPGLPEQSQFAA